MAEVLALDGRMQTGEPELLLGPDDDVRAHAGLHNLGIIGVSFPRFRDGRGYSSARILRETGFLGDVRAVGDLTLDQLVFLKRAGFSSVASDRPIDPEQARIALARFPAAYQRGADAAPAAFELRREALGHGHEAG